MLTPETLQEALSELGQLAHAEGKVIDLAVYGGSALMLASNFRVSTEDIDAVAAYDQDVIDRLGAIVAKRRGWAADWLNDGVRAYLSPNVDGLTAGHHLFRTYPSEQQPGVRIFVPTAEYILAMKLMAMRIDETTGKSDLNDILNLIAVVGLKTPEETLTFVSHFYPEARISGRLQLGIRELWRTISGRTKDTADAPPRYLGRSGQTPD